VVESIFSTFRSKHSVAGSISKPITTNKGKEKVTNNLLAPQVASSQTLNVENMSNMINNNMPNFAGARTYSPSTSASQTTTNRAQGPVTGGAHINL
jgi:hypothetical protein